MEQKQEDEVVGYAAVTSASLTHLSLTCYTYPQVAAGFQHVLCLTKDGKIWAWGRGDGGQLGNARRENSRAGSLVASPHNVVKVAAGFSHSACLTEEGKAYVWGEAHGLGADAAGRDQLVPREVVMPQGVVVEDMACSNFHTSLIGRLPGGERQLYLVGLPCSSSSSEHVAVSNYADLRSSVSILAEGLSPFTVLVDNDKKTSDGGVAFLELNGGNGSQAGETLMWKNEWGTLIPGGAEGWNITQVSGGVGHVVYLVDDGKEEEVVVVEEKEESKERPLMYRCQEEGNAEYGFL